MLSYVWTMARAAVVAALVSGCAALWPAPEGAPPVLLHDSLFAAPSKQVFGFHFYLRNKTAGAASRGTDAYRAMWKDSRIDGWCGGTVAAAAAGTAGGQSEQQQTSF